MQKEYTPTAIGGNIELFVLGFQGFGADMATAAVVAALNFDRNPGRQMGKIKPEFTLGQRKRVLGMKINVWVLIHPHQTKF